MSAPKLSAYDHLTAQEQAFLALLRDGADPGAATIPDLLYTIGELRAEHAAQAAEIARLERETAGAQAMVRSLDGLVAKYGCTTDEKYAWLDVRLSERDRALERVADLEAVDRAHKAAMLEARADLARVGGERDAAREALDYALRHMRDPVDKLFTLLTEMNARSRKPTAPAEPASDFDAGTRAAEALLEQLTPKPMAPVVPADPLEGKRPWLDAGHNGDEPAAPVASGGGCKHCSEPSYEHWRFAVPHGAFVPGNAYCSKSDPTRTYEPAPVAIELPSFKAHEPSWAEQQCFALGMYVDADEGCYSIEDPRVGYVMGDTQKECARNALEVYHAQHSKPAAEPASTLDLHTIGKPLRMLREDAAREARIAADEEAVRQRRASQHSKPAAYVVPALPSDPDYERRLDAQLRERDQGVRKVRDSKPADEPASEHACGDDCMPARNLHFVSAPPSEPRVRVSHEEASDALSDVRLRNWRQIESSALIDRYIADCAELERRARELVEKLSVFLACKDHAAERAVLATGDALAELLGGRE